MAYAQELGYDVTPIEAYVRYDNGRYLDGWYNRLRDAFFATMADLGVHADLSPADFLTAMDDYKSGDPELATVVSAVKATVRPVLSDDPVLQHDLRLPDSWWQDLVGTLEKVAAVDTDRIAVRQQYMDRAIPEFLGIPAPAVTCWTSAHSDLYWANVTVPLRILDWEGWGRAPTGFDAATLYAYTLLQPDTAV